MAKAKLSFAQILNKSNNEIVKERANRLAQSTFRAQRRLIDRLEEEVQQIKDRMKVSLDLNPKNTYSLMRGEDFKPDEWVEQYQSWKIDLADKEFDLKCAKETMEELFPDGEKEFEESET